MAFRVLAIRLWPAFGRGRYDSRENGRYVRRFVERMGGMWVVMARMASLRVDLLGAGLCQELSLTRDRAMPVPMGVLRKVIDEELQKRGATVDQVFDELHERPMNARAFSQFHLGRLKEGGHQVVVRVRPPDAVQRAKTDWAHMQFFLGLFERFGILPHLRWKALMFEVKKATDDQLDFRTEEAEVRRISKILRSRRIYVPRLHRRYTGERLLVSEYIRGVSVEDLDVALRQDREGVALWMQQNGINPPRICRRLFQARLELLFEHNMFYTELLPRNVLLLRRNRIALLTLNTIGTLETTVVRQYQMLCQALVAEDYTKVCDSFLSMGPPLPRKDLSGMRTAVMRSLKVWTSRTYIKSCWYSEKSLSAAMLRLEVCAGLYRLPASWDLTRLHFAEQTLDRTLEILDRGLSCIKELGNYARASQRRAIERAVSMKSMGQMRNLSDLVQVGMQLAENFQFDNDYLRRRVMGFQGSVGRAVQVARRMVTMLMRVAMVVIALEGFLYFKNGDHLAMGQEGGLPGRWLGDLLTQSRWTWVVVLAGVLYIGRYVLGLTRELFKEEIRPVGSR
nr:ABC-1 domain protein [Chondromyces crocatus]